MQSMTPMNKLMIFDLNRTLYDPDTKTLMPGALDVLSACTDAGMPLALVSRKEPGRDVLLSKLGIDHLFVSTTFVEKKDADLFLSLMKRHGVEPQHTYIVGDYLYEEIRAGNSCGAKTIWFQNGPFVELLPEGPHDIPWRRIRSLSELMPLCEI